VDFDVAVNNSRGHKTQDARRKTQEDT